MFIDTHCHLDFPEYEHDREEVLLRSRDQGVEYIINVGSSLQNSLNSVDLAKKYDFVYAAVGIHPHEADSFNESTENEIRRLAKAEKVVAIGEIGLDYFKNFSKQENQRPVFVSLIKVAEELNLPLVIHSRQAAEDTLKFLKDSKPVKAVVHCFSGDENFLRECLDFGFFVSFTCNITYKKAQNLRDVAGLTPLERIFLETDAPYLSPELLRGKRNEPVNVKFVAEELARIKGVSVEKVAEVTTASAKKFFNLK